jgi:hypothetical protein
MKRFLIVALAVALAPLASAQLYKYIDANGKTVYTDQPPASVDPKALRIPPSAVGSGPAATSKSAVQQDKDLQKGRDKLKDEEKKADEKAQRAAADEQRCQSAKNAYQIYADGGRITKYNEKGEKIFLGDDEIDAEREKSRRVMDEACKKG